MTSSPSIHANCVVAGERGVLIRGRSGAGKSSFSASLIALAQARGLFARLVADDRTVIRATHGRLIASAPPSIAGLMERRGAGVVATAWLREAVLRLVVDIEPIPDRMPADAAGGCEIDGVTLPRLVVAEGDPDGPGLALWRLDAGRAGATCGPLALAFAPQHEKIASSALERAVHPARPRRGGARRPLTGAQ